jgi:hypothetical protein
MKTGIKLINEKSYNELYHSQNFKLIEYNSEEIRIDIFEFYRCFNKYIIIDDHDLFDGIVPIILKNEKVMTTLQLYELNYISEFINKYLYIAEDISISPCSKLKYKSYNYTKFNKGTIIYDVLGNNLDLFLFDSYMYVKNFMGTTDLEFTISGIDDTRQSIYRTIRYCTAE